MANAYTFPFWPTQPWDPDPDTSTWDAVLRAGRTGSYQDWSLVKPLRIGEDETDWHGIEVLGTGSFGTAVLFVKTDANGDIIDRMVVKEVLASKDEWNNLFWWRNNRPREIDIHERIDSCRPRDSDSRPQLLHLVQHRDSRVMMNRRRHRVYLDFYPRGSLQDATKECFDKWSEFYKHQRPEPGPEFRVSEAYIWYVFGALVDACLVLQNGRDQVQPITHCDVALRNIFLIDSSEPGEENWPRPVLGDFGHAFYVMNDPSENPREYTWDHRAHAYAVEQQTLCEVLDVNNLMPINEKTDVLDIGIVLWSLVTNVLLAHGVARDEGCIHSPVWLGHDYSRNTEKILTGEVYTAAKHYSDALQDLVRDCLSWSQADRPSLWELQGLIQTNRSRPLNSLRESNLRGIKKDDVYLKNKLAETGQA